MYPLSSAGLKNPAQRSSVQSKEGIIVCIEVRRGAVLKNLSQRNLVSKDFT
jgi:hypothetical protein